jgi:hypothetical protein
VSVWYEHKVIDADHHAFLRGESTAQSIYVRKFALADAKFRNQKAVHCDNGRRSSICIMHTIRQSAGSRRLPSDDLVYRRK